MTGGDTGWSVSQARTVYGLARGDLDFLDVNDDGDLCICIDGHRISLPEIIRRVQQRDGTRDTYTSSFTVRIPQLITDRIRRLRAAFRRVLDEKGYKGRFLPVYPVKVNQRHDYVMAVARSDPEYGFEAGTKAELVLLGSLLADERDRIIVCNGAKDPEYLRMIRRHIKSGHKLWVSVESLHEAQLITDIFDPASIHLVLRLKPYLHVEGYWSHSAGRDSKFGLSIHDLLCVVDHFRSTGFAGSVSAILGHVGSQVTDMEGLRHFGAFMVDMYSQLRELGLTGLRTIDLGGGLPIDYTSSYRGSYIDAYADSIISGLVRALDTLDCQDHPDLMVEAGRGITATSSLVVVRVLEVRSVYPPSSYVSDPALSEVLEAFRARLEQSESADGLGREWRLFHERFTQRTSSLQQLLKDEALVGAARALVRERARALGVTSLVAADGPSDPWAPEHIAIGNFSVFNSIADHVLVGQYFPAVPVTGLDTRPETTIRLADITCDSDGEFSQFYRRHTGEVWYTLDDRPITTPGGQMGLGIPIPRLDGLKGSYIVLALLGAYQDTIEMNHNLLGDLLDVELSLKDGQWMVRWMGGAESIRDVLEDQGYSGISAVVDPYMSDNGTRDD